MACLKGVVSHMSCIIIHQNKPTRIDIHHVKGFHDWPTQSREKGFPKIAPDAGTHCISKGPFPSCCLLRCVGIK